MDKFYDWLYEEKRIFKSEQESLQIQMLIGYMIEYCEKRNLYYEWDFGVGIDGIYGYLKRLIDESIVVIK